MLGTYPAKEHCSQCGLCDTYYIAHVKEACAFLGDGMSKVEKLEAGVHGRKRGIVTSVAMQMLQSGKVDGVVCVQSQDNDPMAPKPILATSVEEVLASRGVKPCLSPNLSVLDEVEKKGIKSLLFIGVGCSVSALRAIEPHLRQGGLENLYVLGTFCVDNGPNKGLKKFLKAASDEPETVTNYEFMQDYNTPYFSLPADDLKDVIAPSCYSCFDYMNNLADLVVGYMGVPWQNRDMNEHEQTVVVRNAKGSEMLELIRSDLDISPPMESGDRTPFVLETVKTDDQATLGPEYGGTTQQPAPRFVGRIIAWILEKIGPKGLEFARYSLDYHWIRNYLYVQRNFKAEHADRHVPEYVKKIVSEYDKNGEVTKRSMLGRRPPKKLF
eukprot:jgi/Bigna1/92839/estExt_fgenesh1_pm.C_800009